MDYFFITSQARGRERRRRVMPSPERIGNIKADSRRANGTKKYLKSFQQSLSISFKVAIVETGQC